MQPLTVMSFNLRGPFDEPPLDWAHRRVAVQRLLAETSPHVIGAQEVMFDVAEDIASWGYRWIGLGRDGGSRGEHMAIFFDPARVRPLALDHVWLSDEPTHIGSCTWPEQDCVRMLTWVRFADTDGSELVFGNTHLDHASAEARRRGAELVADTLEMAAGESPLVLTGDFNDVPGSLAYEVLTSHVTDAFTGSPDAGVPTFHGYGLTDEVEVIDWILTRGLVVQDARLLRTDGPQPASDHHALLVRVS